MITREQIKGALSGLGWTYQDLNARLKTAARKANEPRLATSVNSISGFLKAGDPGDLGYKRVELIEQVLLEAGAEFGEANWVNVPKDSLKKYKPTVKK